MNINTNTEPLYVLYGHTDGAEWDTRTLPTTAGDTLKNFEAHLACVLVEPNPTCDPDLFAYLRRNILMSATVALAGEAPFWSYGQPASMGTVAWGCIIAKLPFGETLALA